MKEKNNPPTIKKTRTIKEFTGQEKFAQLYGELNTAELWMQGTNKQIFITAIPHEFYGTLLKYFSDYNFILIEVIDDIGIYAMTSLSAESWKIQKLIKTYNSNNSWSRHIVLGLLLGYSWNKIIEFLIGGEI